MSAEPAPGVAAGRLWAASRFPYLASGLFGAQVVAQPGIGTVSVDGEWRLHADPELTAGWTAAQFGSVLVHHVSHLLRAHGERAVAAAVADEDARAWVRGADAEINDDLVPAGLDLPGRPVLPRHLGAADGLLAEQYFAPGPAAGEAGWELDCGSGADGRPRGWDGGPPGLSSWQARLLCRQVAQECVRHAREAGHVPAGLLRWAEQVLEPVVDWRRVLAAELRRAVADTVGAVDYSYRRPSRRAPVSGSVVLPALRRPVPEVAVVCDTSGSMTEDLLAAALAEVDGLLRSLGLARQVRVLACDTAVGPARRVTSARQVELIGGGGTDMGAGIAAAAALRPRPAVTVVLTDGFTPWPGAPPRGSRVVVALLGDEAPDAPGWARAVRVPSAAA
ncbi:MAG TPA: VWA-like domain-containing protein [Streptosporangiaceae bacterium]|nr:VWA-like domain-containing protein [Streptosporangiaceae bacterium]